MLEQEEKVSAVIILVINISYMYECTHSCGENNSVDCELWWKLSNVGESKNFTINPFIQPFRWPQTTTPVLSHRGHVMSQREKNRYNQELSDLTRISVSLGWPSKQMNNSSLEMHHHEPLFPLLVLPLLLLVWELVWLVWWPNRENLEPKSDIDVKHV